jgi:uncharacterized membrane-anchored protein
MTSDTQTVQSFTGLLLNKVPEVTIYFWLIKVLSTTVGETAADFLDTNLNLGLTTTTLILAGLLIAALIGQFRAGRYVPAIYWMAVVLISIVGTLITDNLSDNYDVPLEVTTAVFAGALAVAFAVWYRAERTLSIHTIITRRRESFYWLAILFTFALGTAAGDLVAEKLSLGYSVSLILFTGLIAAICVARFAFRLDATACFWAGYVLTRPLGASLGDLLSQSRDADGLGLGTTATSGIFLTAIVVLVAYLTITKTDVDAEPALASP